MKFISILLFVVSASPVYANMFKCELNGITSYQEKPCTSKGSEFELRKDISEEQHNEAVTKLNQEIAVSNEKKRIAKEASDKERLIRAQEEQAEADFENARQIERQAEALDALKKKRNKRFYRLPRKNQNKLPVNKAVIHKKSLYKK